MMNPAEFGGRYPSQQSYHNSHFDIRSLQNNHIQNFQQVGGESERIRSLLLGGGSDTEQQQLLLRIEHAVALGDHKYAASLAKELSKLKISSPLSEQEDKADGIKDQTRERGTERQSSRESSVSGRLSTKSSESAKLTIKAEMYVEDAVSAQGPIQVNINPTITVAELKHRSRLSLRSPQGYSAGFWPKTWPPRTQQHSRAWGSILKITRFIFILFLQKK